MKSITSFIAAAILAAFAIQSADARVAVSVDFFYNHLGAYGSWRQVGDYGYCWHPDGVGNDWSPYSDGRWVYTDAGWTWDTEEPYGWAVYHYGRWANVGGVGWVWVPGTEWGPGWVSWRHSPRYVGLAPLPPEARFRVSIGFNSRVDDNYNIGPGNYRFVEGRDFGNRHLNSVFVDRRQNNTIIHQTTNITNITYVNSVVHNGGMDYENQSHLSNSPINRYKLNRRNDFEGDPRGQKAEQFRSQVAGDSLNVMAPTFSGKATSAPAKTAGKVANAQVSHGWENAGTPAEAAALRTRMKSNAAEPRELPKKSETSVEPKRSPMDKPKSAPEADHAKAGKHTQSEPDRNPPKVKQAPARQKAAETVKPQHPTEAEPSRNSPKHVEKNNKAEPQRPESGNASKPKNERKPEFKNQEPQAQHEKSKGPDRNEKDASGEAPKP